MNYMRFLTEEEVYQERIRKHKTYCIGLMFIFGAGFILSMVCSWIFHLQYFLIAVDIGTFGLTVVAYSAYKNIGWKR